MIVCFGAWCASQRRWQEKLFKGILEHDSYFKAFRERVLVPGTDNTLNTNHKISSALKKTVQDIFCVCSAAW